MKWQTKQAQSPGNNRTSDIWDVLLVQLSAPVTRQVTQSSGANPESELTSTARVWVHLKINGVMINLMQW